MTKVKKIALSLAVIIAFSGYAFFSGGQNGQASQLATSGGAAPLPQGNAGNTQPVSQPVASQPADTKSATPPASTAVTQSGSSGASSAPPPQSAGLYKNGTYTGPAANAFYGMVQVQAIVRGGKIADVKFLQHPGGRWTSDQINAQAMPYLIQEALSAQNANVNTISGASETSRAFRISLAGALQNARN